MNSRTALQTKQICKAFGERRFAVDRNVSAELRLAAHRGFRLGPGSARRFGFG